MKCSYIRVGRVTESNFCRTVHSFISTLFCTIFIWHNFGIFSADFQINFRWHQLKLLPNCVKESCAKHCFKDKWTLSIVSEISHSSKLKVSFAAIFRNKLVHFFPHIYLSYLFTVQIQIKTPQQKNVVSLTLKVVKSHIPNETLAKKTAL